MNGVIINQVLSPTEIAEYLYEIKKTAYINKSQHSMIKNGGHAPFMVKIRNNTKVKQVFADLWKCKPSDLVASFDTYGIMLKGDDPVPLWPHRDEHINMKKRCYQGFVQLTNNKNEGLVVWPESNKKPYISPDDVNTDINAYKLVTARAGSLVLWDSKLVHCNLNNGERDRIVMYVCMVPKQKVSKSALAKLEKYNNNKITTNHTPFFPSPHN